MVNHFDHRFSTYEGATQAQLNVGALPRLDAAAHAAPHRYTQPDYWVSETHIQSRLAGKTDRQWLVGWRDICRNTDQRTVIPAVVPRAGVGNKLPLLFSPRDPQELACFAAVMTGLVLDYAARQKIGGTSLTYFYLKQFPLPSPAFFTPAAPWQADTTVAKWLLPRIVELTYTAWDLEPLGADCGYPGPPFVWDEERRFLLRVELDAAFFHLYLGTPDEWSRYASDALKSALPTPRDAVSHIMETFPIVKKKDLESFGTYRTKDTILEIYDDKAAAIRTGQPYQTRLSPPSAAPSVRHHGEAGQD